VTPRARLEAAIEWAITLLDQIDGDTDLEPDQDCSADDLGEREGDTWLSVA
jgi:hypothetical protein